MAISGGKRWRVLSCCAFFWYQKKEKLDAVLFLRSEGDERLLDPSMGDSVEEGTGSGLQASSGEVVEASGLWGSEVAESSDLQRP